MAEAIKCVIMRGGTSKAVFLKEADLPQDEDARRRLILRVFGSPDRRQIDGLGGADPLTSKLAIIGPPPADRPEAQLTYTFGQVEIDTPEIDWRSLCGNISSAVGAYAIEEGMVAPSQPLTRVTVFNTNLGRLLSVEVPITDGHPAERGDYVVPGVPGSGARISVDFADTAGAATGALLPTGNPVDRLDVPGIGSIEASLVDIGNAHVFVRARDLGLKGTETAAEIDQDTALRARLEAIRGAGAERMGMIAEAAQSRRDSPATPILGVVSEPADYRNDIAGTTVRAHEVDLVSRLQFMQQTHKTYAGTSTVCTGVASRIPGTLVHQVARQRNEPSLRIGHPAGVIETETVVEPVAGGFSVHRATLGRTARRILEGTVYVPDDTLLPA
ncbi:2-methylaconitate cis-trans isomerase PrpF family protein [Afifella sp. IM 167]|uniref:2-methylaconitate cis-trans isomerase PrpF family protein n=1 Tax=Afifella sp. IM 167 TaxID=2033586 RepID=UPI001CD03212|nr:PrpF domain-containing protein [Afifella sp. IM 167]MBZ8132388.1 3-methylitaconate isomerase [Afifella sp. IM 167]